MLLQDVKELVNRLKFDDAIEELEKIIFQNSSENLSEAYQLLLYLLQSKDIQKYQKIEFEYFQYLKNENKNEHLYKLLKTKSLSGDLDEFEKAKIFLEVLWKLGRIKEFSQEVKRINIFLLESKRLNNYMDFYSFVTSKTKKFDFLEIGVLINFIDKGDDLSVKTKLEEILNEKIYSNRLEESKRLKLIDSLIAILEDDESEKVELYYCKTLLFIIKQALTSREVDTKLVIEFMLLLNKGIHGIYLLELNIEHAVKEKIADYLKKSFQFKKKNIPAYCKVAKTYFDNSIVITKKDLASEASSEKIKIPSYPVTSSQYRLVGLSQKPILTQEEKNLITQFEHEQVQESELRSLIVSFIELEMYYLAKKLAHRLAESANKNYLLAEIHLRLTEYADVIYFCNSALDTYELSSDEKVAFLYLKQRTYEYSNKPQDEYKVLKEIAKLDPMFMDVGGKLSR